VLRVARTLADLDHSNGVEAGHIGEALRYRPAVSETAAA
jgi:predicted ATPase with chaperone activity